MSVEGPPRDANFAPPGQRSRARGKRGDHSSGSIRSVHPALRGERGLALIVAMLIAALAAAVAVSVATAQSRWSAQVSHRRDQVQAQSIALAGVQWARQILDAHVGPIDHLGEPWALPLPATPVDNGDVEGRIVDAQGLFNVDNLASAAHGTLETARFARLFASLGIPRSTLSALVDWVDADDVPQADGAEDAWYVAQPEPSLAANAPAFRVQELAAVRGMTLAAMTRLVRYVTSLPVPDTPLNVNTAPVELIAASLDNADPAKVAALVASRAANPFASLADFRARLPDGVTMGDESMYSVGSHYFLVSVRARQGETIAQAHALIERAGSTSSIVWQTME